MADGGPIPDIGWNSANAELRSRRIGAENGRRAAYPYPCVTGGGVANDARSAAGWPARPTRPRCRPRRGAHRPAGRRCGVLATLQSLWTECGSCLARARTRGGGVVRAPGGPRHGPFGARRPCHDLGWRGDGDQARSDPRSSDRRPKRLGGNNPDRRDLRRHRRLVDRRHDLHCRKPGGCAAATCPLKNRGAVGGVVRRQRAGAARPGIYSARLRCSIGELVGGPLRPPSRERPAARTLCRPSLCGSKRPNRRCCKPKSQASRRSVLA